MRSHSYGHKIDGHIVHARELNENGPVMNCTGSLMTTTCELTNLKPLTNYSITVAAYRISEGGSYIFGDESASQILHTGKLDDCLNSWKHLHRVYYVRSFGPLSSEGCFTRTTDSVQLSIRPCPII